MAETENRFFNEPPTIGSTSKIQYDTSDPTYVLLVDGSTIRMGDAIYILILSFVGLGIGAVGIAKRARQRSVFLRGR
ncbi:hypothetical protein C7534_14019 [Pseudomonas sp. OV226]|nr:hypothetical protein C7534_14019 [Pseudomonas sp. OV226]